MDPAEKIVNRAGRESSIGNTGKFYCGGPLITPCKCCDGNCGLENGENCLGCMELDVKMRSLPRGYLVNSRGLICRVNVGKSFLNIGRLEIYCGGEKSEFEADPCTKMKPCFNC